MQKRGPRESRKIILFPKNGEKRSPSVQDVVRQAEAQEQMRLSHAWKFQDTINRGAAGEELTEDEKKEFPGWDQVKFAEAKRLLETNRNVTGREDSKRLETGLPSE